MGAIFLKRHCLLVLISLMTSTQLWGADNIRMGYIEFPPVFSTNADGKAVGYLIDLTNKVALKAGYQVEAQSFPTKRMAKMIADGGLDLWVGLATLPEFEGTTYIGESAVATIELHAYTIGKQDPIFNKEDLIGKNILIMRAYSYGGLVGYIKDPKNRIHYMEVDSHTQGLNMLKAGRSDYFLGYRGPVSRVLEKIKVHNLQSNVISSLKAYFVVSKKSPFGKKLLIDLEEAYKQVAEGSQ